MPKKNKNHLHGLVDTVRLDRLVEDDVGLSGRLRTRIIASSPTQVSSELACFRCLVALRDACRKVGTVSANRGSVRCDVFVCLVFHGGLIWLSPSVLGHCSCSGDGGDALKHKAIGRGEPASTATFRRGRPKQRLKQFFTHQTTKRGPPPGSPFD